MTPTVGVGPHDARRLGAVVDDLGHDARPGTHVHNGQTALVGELVDGIQREAGAARQLVDLVLGVGEGHVEASLEHVRQRLLHVSRTGGRPHVGVLDAGRRVDHREDVFLGHGRVLELIEGVTGRRDGDEVTRRAAVQQADAALDGVQDAADAGQQVFERPGDAQAGTASHRVEEVIPQDRVGVSRHGISAS